METPLLRQIRVATALLDRNLAGLREEECRTVPPSGGSSVQWIVGHLVASRAGALRILGDSDSPCADRRALFGRGSSPEAAAKDGPSVEELRGDFGLLGGLIEKRLAAATSELLAQPLPEPREPLGATAGSALAFLVLHEAYHIGQVGILRRALGHEAGIP